MPVLGCLWISQRPGCWKSAHGSCMILCFPSPWKYLHPSPPSTPHTRHSKNTPGKIRQRQAVLSTCHQPGGEETRWGSPDGHRLSYSTCICWMKEQTNGKCCKHVNQLCGIGIDYARGCCAHFLVAKCYSNVACILASTEVANKVATLKQKRKSYHSHQ